MDNKLQDLIKKYNNNKKNSILELRIHNLKFLDKYRNDDLYKLIQAATERGFNGIEWIDFWGVGGINIDMCVKWVYDIIKEQELYGIIEPYYNNINQRLGIIIIRNKLNEVPVCLPLELQDKNKKIIKIETINENDEEQFIKLSSSKIINPEYKKKSRIRRLSNKITNFASKLSKSFSGSSISSIASNTSTKCVNEVVTTKMDINTLTS